MMEKSLVLRVYGNSPQMRIIDFLMEFPTNEFTSGEIIENVKMSKTTLYKCLDDLSAQGMIRLSKAKGKAIACAIDMKNPIIQTIKTGVDIASGEIADKQLTNERFLSGIRASAKNRESLMARKKLLREELNLTNESLKTMTLLNN
ncbi:MAG: hypothetical protein COV65_07095 [Nitrosopumilales archaeon CG11_big_fil_rev_8_21_14_0_20_33_24]|jgi:transcription initiation factor IIE alpha subunit|nr:MAG: hypothetical protein COV65_07095 [Nitrosopumilales archaeon CG11_big_fil_rev_8_21_14_0_20_33_24]